MTRPITFTRILLAGLILVIIARVPCPPIQLQHVGIIIRGPETLKLQTASALGDSAVVIILIVAVSLVCALTQLPPPTALLLRVFGRLQPL